MPIARFEMPDGRIGRFEVPEGTTPEQAQVQIAAAMKAGGAAPKRDLVREGALQAAAETPTWEKGLVSLGAGLADVGQGVKQLFLKGKDAVTGSKDAPAYDAQVANDKKIRDTYEEVTPGGTIGRVTGAAFPTLLIPAGSAARGAGAVVSKVAPKVGAAVADSVMADAALTGAVQGGVMATGEGETHLGNAAKGAAGGAATVGALNVVGAAAAPFIKKAANAINPVAAKNGGMVVNGELAPEVVRALEKEGIDVPNLTASAREKLLAMAADAVKGSPVSPKELARAARLESLPVPMTGTKGQLSKDFAQNQLEQSLGKSASSGAPLREAWAQQEEKLGANLDAFRGQTGAKIANEGDAGRSVNAAVQARIDRSNKNVSKLYRDAEKLGQTLGPIDSSPLAKWVVDNSSDALSIPAINSIADKLKKAGAIEIKDGVVTATGKAIPIDVAENIYRSAGTLGKQQGAGHHMRELKNLVNDMTEGVGGDAYRAARSARLKHGLEFEDPSVIQNVVGMKSRTDRSVPFEDVFKKTVINGSIDDLKTLKGTLLANDRDTREAGVQAFKDLRGQAMQFLKDAATNNAHGDTSEAALRRAYNQIGPEKMRELFGGNTAKQFENFLEAVKDLKVAPKGTQNTSGTAGEIINWVDRILGMVPTKIGKAAATGVKKLAESAKASGQVADAVDPLAANEVARKASVEAQQNERVRALLESKPVKRFKSIAASLGAAGAAQ